MRAAIKPFAVKLFLGVVFLFPVFLMVQSVSAANTISGRVYDRQRNFLVDVDVELLDEYYRLLPGGRTKTDGSGRYKFEGLNDGNYTVKVLPFRYDLQDQSQYLEISSISARPGVPGSSYITQDFYLTPKKGGIRDAELSVVFVQDIPKDAEKLYKKAIDDLSGGRADEGILELKEAVRKFPNYYLAQLRLGQELCLKKKYGESVEHFIRAAEINQKSATSFYYIGYALYNLGRDYNKAATTALNQASLLAPASVQILWMLGKVERDSGKFGDAEKHLLKAKKLSTAKIPEIHMELSQLYANDLKKYKEAADELELYLKASKPKDEDEKKLRRKIEDLRTKAKTQFASV